MTLYFSCCASCYIRQSTSNGCCIIPPHSTSSVFGEGSLESLAYTHSSRSCSNATPSLLRKKLMIPKPEFSQHLIWTVNKNDSDENNFFSALGFLIFVHIQGIWKFLGWGSNPCFSSDLSRPRDNARSLTHCATAETPRLSFLSQEWPVFYLKNIVVHTYFHSNLSPLSDWMLSGV